MSASTLSDQGFLVFHDVAGEEAHTAPKNWYKLSDFNDEKQDDNALQQVFENLANEWRQEQEFSSSITEIAIVPAYQQIIGMGPAALRWILADLRETHDHWFWALKSIARCDPVLPQDRGNVPAMAKAWLEWGKQRRLC